MPFPCKANCTSTKKLGAYWNLVPSSASSCVISLNSFFKDPSKWTPANSAERMDASTIRDCALSKSVFPKSLKVNKEKSCLVLKRSNVGIYKLCVLFTRNL